MPAPFTPPPNWPPTPEGWTPPPGWQPDPMWGPAPEGWNFYPDHRANPVAEQFTPIRDKAGWSDDDRAQGLDDGSSEPPRRFPRWLAYAAAALVIFLVGLGMGSTGNREPTAAQTSEPAPVETVIVTAPPSERESDLDAREADLNDRETQLSDFDAEVKAREELVAAAEGDLKTRQDAVAAREGSADEADAQEAANTISGEGVSLVNSQVQPGTYQTSGNDGCYWARLSGTTGEFREILANDNVNGDSVVTILPTDIAFERSRCNQFTKID